MRILKSDPQRLLEGKEEEEIVGAKKIKFVSTGKIFEISFTSKGNLDVRKSSASNDRIGILNHCADYVIIS